MCLKSGFLLSFLLVILSITNHVTLAQSASSPEQEQIAADVRAQLDAMAGDNGILRQFCTKNEITGTFVFDMTIQGKGDVLTVFMVARDGENVAQKNLLKDKLHTLRFENIRLPKNQRVKFRHSLQF